METSGGEMSETSHAAAAQVHKDKSRWRKKI
jgi:hypothetical protein